jgi:hypothetical protein
LFSQLWIKSVEDASQEKKEKEKKKEPESQFYKSGRSFIAEAILVGDFDSPKWLVSSENGTISVRDSIEESGEDGKKVLIMPPLQIILR